ncbi:MAG: helicase HerA-like domain-containing protein [Candidatus Asgardarchaeia archaeon]
MNIGENSLKRTERDGLYLGKKIRRTSKGKELDGEYLLPVLDLLTHCVILGRTGSGKTVLGKVIIEEAALKGIPSIVIDLKGDLSSIAIVLDRIDPANFEPWIEGVDDKGRRMLAEEEARMYRENLSLFGIDEKKISKFLKKVNFIIFTPKSLKGLPISISPIPEPPSNLQNLMSEEPDYILKLVDMISESLLRRAYRGEDISKLVTEQRYISELIGYIWRSYESIRGNNVLELLIRYIEEPPISRLGIMEIDKVIPKRKRHELAVAINNLLVGSEKLLYSGDPLDIDYLLKKYSKNSKVPIFIINLSEVINSEERMFIVSRVAFEIYRWMIRKGGSTYPRLLFYIDEIGGGGGREAFFPSTREPVSKAPLMLLVKQGRAFGVCCVFATQNPGDIDYKALGNCGTWIIGNLQTERDRQKVFQGLKDAEVYSESFGYDIEDTIVGLDTGEFLIKDKRGNVEVFRERWLMSYHKTLSPDELKKISSKYSFYYTLMESLRYLPIEHPIDEKIVESFMDCDLRMEIAGGEYSPEVLVELRPKARAYFVHPMIKDGVSVEKDYDTILITATREGAGDDYIQKVLNLKGDDLRSAKEGPPPYGLEGIRLRRDYEDEIRRLYSTYIAKSKADLSKDLNGRIGELIDYELKEKVEAIVSEIRKIESKLRSLENEVSYHREEIRIIDEELKELREEKKIRVKRRKPVYRINERINSRMRKRALLEMKIKRLLEERKILNEEIKGMRESLNSLRMRMRKKYLTVSKDVKKLLSPFLTFERVSSFVLPIARVNVKISNDESERYLNVSWNAYNGSRIPDIGCEVCGRVIGSDEKLGICHYCISVLCEDDKFICEACGKVCCREHSWVCSCGRNYCIDENKYSCTVCGKTVCENCMTICDICGLPLCEEHVFECPSCGRKVCDKEGHYELCSVCGEKFCIHCVEECKGCHNFVCKEDMVTCPNCGQRVCKNCLREKRGFLGLRKKTVCVLCEKS